MATPSTSSTTLPGGDAICVDGGTITRATVRIGKLRGASGDETFTMKGTMILPAGVASSLDPMRRGLQILLEDLGTGARVLDLTADGTPVPPGGRGTGCGSQDGWRKLFYRNLSGQLPPRCTADSAQGLRSIRLVDERARGGGIDFVVTGRNATVVKPSTPLRLTIVLGADHAAGLAGECATQMVQQAACKAKRSVFRCK
jgi:hypothetical protein